jgi:hypothetical protein
LPLTIASQASFREAIEINAETRAYWKRESPRSRNSKKEKHRFGMF